MQQYLRCTTVIDFENPAVRSLASELARDKPSWMVAANCFNWVRDNIRHSIDHSDCRITISASEVLRHRTGLCYAKSHLLAAILRANDIPCGFVYQRLAVDQSATKFCLHGLNAVWIDRFGWYRVDPRGDREGIATSFDPPREKLAFGTSIPGESLIEEIFADPLLVVLSSLARYSTVQELSNNLPDWNIEQPRATEPAVSNSEWSPT